MERHFYQKETAEVMDELQTSLQGLSKEEAAGRLERDGRLEHIVVCGGIHYDNINPEWIPKIVALCSQLGERLVRELNQRLEVQEGDTSWNVPG